MQPGGDSLAVSAQLAASQAALRTDFAGAGHASNLTICKGA
jgi:hypothetical protein